MSKSLLPLHIYSARNNKSNFHYEQRTRNNMKRSSSDTFSCTVPEFCCKNVHGLQNFTGEGLSPGSAENETLALDVTSWCSSVWLCRLGIFICYIHFFFLWLCDPIRVMASSFLRFLDHTQRRTTVGRTPLDE